MSEKITQGNRSVEKAFQIIEILAHNQKPMRLNTIAKRCNMPSSTVLRMLTTLENYGYVQQDAETTQYFLTIKFCHLSNLVSRQMSIRNTIRPYLLELSERVREYITIAIERDMSLYYIDDINSQSNTALTVSDNVGRVAMLHSTGIGKLFLSQYDEQKIDYYIAKFGLIRFTQNTLCTKKRLMENLALIRERGYSIDNEENEVGIRSIAAPVYDTTGNIITGISIAVPTPRCTREQIHSYSQVLLSTTQRISNTFFSDKPDNGSIDIGAGIL